MMGNAGCSLLSVSLLEASKRGHRLHYKYNDLEWPNGGIREKPLQQQTGLVSGSRCILFFPSAVTVSGWASWRF